MRYVVYLELGEAVGWWVCGSVTCVYYISACISSSDMPCVRDDYLDLKEVFWHPVDLLETLGVRLIPGAREPGRHLPRLRLRLLSRVVLRLL